MGTDEGGRCVLTDLYPSECGCKMHRNSVDPERDYSGLRVTATAIAQYDGQCAMTEDHALVQGTTIGLAQQVTPAVRGAHVAAAIGWVCSKCITAIRTANP